MVLFKTVRARIARVVSAALVLNLAFAGAALASNSDQMSTIKSATVANHEITFTAPWAVGAGGSFTITFPSDFSFPMGFAAGDVDVTDVTQSNYDESLASASAGDTWGVSISSNVITFSLSGSTASSAQVTSGDILRIKLGTNATLGFVGSHQITNPTVASATSYTINIAKSGDTTVPITVEIIPDDAVAVTASVVQSLSFSLSRNSVTFGTLSLTDTKYAGYSSASTTESVAHTMSAATNATSGYTIYVKGATLASGGNVITAIGSTAASLAAGTSQFGMRVTASGGSGGAVSPYATSGYAYTGTAVSSVSVASASSASSNTTYSVYYGANISEATVPGSYSTTLTYTIVGNY